MLFNTVKSKIILISALMLIMLSILLSAFAYLYLQSGKTLLLKGYSHYISNFAEKINKDIIRIEDNAKDLALQGEMFNHIDKDRNMALFTTINIFKNYPSSLGGGIWFEPNVIDPVKRWYCIYVYRNKNNEIIPDEQFETEEYDYLNKSWYKEIFPNVTKENNVAWSLPYYEKEGSNTLMVTAGAGIYDSNNKKIGISTVDWEISSIIKSVSEMKPTPSSFALFGDEDDNSIIASTDPYMDNSSLLGKPLNTLPWYNQNLINITYFDYHGQKFIPYVKSLNNGMVLIICIPKVELFYYLIKHVVILFVTFMIVGLLISILLYTGLKKYIDTPINKLSDIAHKIGEGNLNTEIKIEKPLEFAQLAKTFNNMAKDIRNITKERQSIESELSLAKEIQASSLPCVFPPFPDKKEFDIYAGMEAAKEVGGDFYDFYFIDDKNFMFLIADVSGKGVPAALFMMTTKTLINYIAQSGLPPKDMIETINRKICENNKQGFFITLLAGIVNIETGKVTFINCGHNPPLIKHENNDFKYLELEPNIVLGAFDSAEFNISEGILNSGDTICIYTDGVTEAINSSGEQFGEERLLQTINSITDGSVEDIQLNIKSKVKEFAQGVAQSDDMTMLTFRYNGKINKTEINDVIAKSIESLFNQDGNEYLKIYNNFATKENYKEFSLWLNDVIAKWQLNSDTTNKLQLISEELYTNIFSYAYPEKEGVVEVALIRENASIVCIFRDWGIPYNPLERPDPDVTLPPENRDMGGLGIYIVKNSVDEISYEYKDNSNVLKMTIFM